MPVLTFLAGYWIIFFVAFFALKESCVSGATMGPNIFVGETECVYPTLESCVKTYEKAPHNMDQPDAKNHCEGNKTIFISSFTKEKYKAEVAGIGNVQLFVNLVFILYARWRFKTKLASLIIRKNSNFCRFSTSIFHKRCSLRSQKSKFYGF